MVASHHGPPAGILHSLEVVETVMEVADMAWEAYERRRHQPHNPNSSNRPLVEGEPCAGDGDTDLQQLREENDRLRAVLEENLALLRSLSKLPVVSEECPPDLYTQLVATVESASFSSQLQALHKTSKDPVDACFPFKEVQGIDLKSVDIVVYDDAGKPSCWVWVTEDPEIDKVEEESEIDGESYVIIGEDQIVDGIANFIARCILSNPKSKGLTHDELHKAVAKSLGSMKDTSMLKKVWRAGKLMYSLSTWGVALAALYRHPFIVKAAAKGIATSGKLLMKAL